MFLVEYNDSQEAYEDLLETSGLNPEKFRDIMLNLLKRTLLNIILLKKNGNPSLYQGQSKVYKEQAKLKEVSLEQVDVAYIQLYAFLFGALGINDIVSSYAEIAEFFNYKTDASFLICRIAQSDYDLYQCVGDMFGNVIPDQFQKGLNKLFQTIFFAQSFYQENHLRELLKKFSYDSSLDLQQTILSSCELNQDNEQLQLKRTLLPAQYEPVFADLVLELKEQITEKLQTQNDKQSQLFGTALAHELNQLNQHKSTLTYKRLAILKAIVNDNEQQILKKIVKEIQIQYEIEYGEGQGQGKIKNIQTILENYSVYINLVFLCNKNFQNQFEVIKNNLQIIFQIIYQMITNTNLNLTTNSILTIFAKQLDETLCLDAFQSDAFRACRSQIKKTQYFQKFNNMGKNFQNQIVDNHVEMVKETCSLCQLQFEKDEIQYRALLISNSNVHTHIQMIPLPAQQTQQYDFFQIVCSCCQHTFHKACLQQNEQKYVLGEYQYLRCTICLFPYNFPFVSPKYIKDTDDKMLAENLDFFLQTLPDKKIMEYYAKYQEEDDFKILKVLDEIFSSVLCNLLFQLLSDITKFKQQNTQILLQDVLALLRIIYQQNKTTMLQQLVDDNKSKMLYGILNLLLQFQIKENKVDNLKSGLNFILSENGNQYAIVEALTQNEINSNFDQKALPYNIEKVKSQLRQDFLQKFQFNFKDFLLKYYLAPCKKKNCNFLPLKRIQGQEQCQYLCLICFKKMCSQFCGQPQRKKIGNLSRHCYKRHFGKTLYLNLRNSQIIIMKSPYITIHKNPLFKNLIGELPYIGHYQSSYYEKFKLNLKAIDQIIEIIIGDQYVHRFFSNIQKVQRSTL
ncbi:unnamed protein product [Paramecium sonneborni]|uniref:Uncharacterized protein n=1 Tax=Paramecium sonneborni TaxID=65129 RepID=A0A8S1QU68_9CILI|nr:unnamed protein product [Paramecium sonneborni]